MTITIIDGMGGSIGYEICHRLRKSLPSDLEIVVLGTNAVATSNMIKGGANRGASGENAIRVSAGQTDIIIGPISILIPNSMMGEITPAIAEAITLSPAHKILLPLTHPRIDLVGVTKTPLPHLMDEVIELVRKKLSLEVKKDV